MPPMNEVLEWRGQTMVGSGGAEIGKIEEIYLDQETEQPVWALVHTGMFGPQATFVPIANASIQGDKVQVPFETAQVKDAPKMEPDGELSQQDAAALYSHYGIDYTEAHSDNGLPEGDRTADGLRGVVGNDVSGRDTDAAMTRSEEELRVGTTQRETGRARLRKHVVTENVTETIPVQREEVRVEREPITDASREAATSGADLEEEEHEVLLHEEQVVVDKTAVPKERVRLDRDTVTEQREVSEEIRKEQIEADGEPVEGRDGVRGTDEGVAR
jgi:uncharacterized protein (TIGR02271 family)